MTQQPKSLPTGIQVFDDLIAEKFLYIDKTEEIFQVVKKKKRTCFLGKCSAFLDAESVDV